MSTSADWICSECGSTDCKVLESRRRKEWRRRRIRCKSCGHRITTYEITAEQFDAYRAAMEVVLQVRPSMHVNRSVVESNQ
jgi:transcriptional regulator NrdR family protein